MTVHYSIEDTGNGQTQIFRLKLGLQNHFTYIYGMLFKRSETQGGKRV